MFQSLNLTTVSQIRTAPVGTQAAQLDLRAAYRCIGTLPEHLPHLVVSLGNSKNPDIYIDLCHPFGLRSSGGNLGYALDASLQALTLTHGVVVGGKWVDDIIPIRYPSPASPDDLAGKPTFEYDLGIITRFLEKLGWQFAPEKVADFSNSVLYLGFFWDFAEKLVSLPENKRSKYHTRVLEWVSKARAKGVTKVDTESLLGTLNHVSKIHTLGRSYLPAAQVFLTQWKSESRFVTRSPPRRAVSDIVTWSHLLSIPNASRSLQPLSDLDPDIWVDASTDWGIGLVCKGRWRAWKLREHWRRERRDIGWAETVALELAILHVDAMGSSGCKVAIRSDNQGSIGQYGKGRGRSAPTNESIRRAALVMMRGGFDIDLHYVRSADNLADGPSRGMGLLLGSRLPNLFPTPRELCELLDEV